MYGLPDFDCFCFMGQFDFKCSTDPHNLQPPPALRACYTFKYLYWLPLGYNPLGLSGHALDK